MHPIQAHASNSQSLLDSGTMRFLLACFLFVALSQVNAGVPPKSTTTCKSVYPSATPKPTVKVTPKPVTKATPKPATKPTSKKCTGVNEVYSECGNNACQNTCAKPNISLVCKATCKCGCICADGFLRNSKGVCVKKSQCDSCKTNEVFSKCDNHPCRDTCAAPDLSTRCRYIPGCYPGCICKDGFLKNKDGVCVPRAECGCPGPNEVYSECGNDSCQKNCDTFGRTDLACRPACNPGCICERNYIRNQDGVCVKPNECENNVCPGDNEEYSDCASPCNTCEVAVTGAQCNFLVCNVGCDCKEGFHRNLDGKCVSLDDCRKEACPNPNEVWSKCSNDPCANTCSEPNRLPACSSLPFDCKAGCVCAEGFLKDPKSGVCVPEKECFCEDPNAESVSCPNPCLGGTCEKPTFDSCKRACIERGCQCKEGFVKNAEERCVLIEDCPKPCEDPNATYSNCGSCQPSCDNPIVESCAAYCRVGCFCNKGYLRDQNGKCVLPEECQCPKPNQVWSKCGANGCQNSCANPTFAQVCKGPCRAGCICADGYIRDSKENCIKPEDCKECPKPNQVWDECGANICQNTCARPNNSIVCKGICKAGCICVEGYLKDSQGNCVKPEDCKECSKPNQVWSDCGAHGCQNTCANPTFAQVCRPAGCKAGCICEDGYIKTSEDDCVKPEDCQEASCQENEVWDKCGNTGCVNTCAEPDLITRCLPAGCIAGCICEQGYLRNEDKKCVLPEQCEERCRDDPNTVFDPCGEICPTTCANKDVRPRPCPAVSCIHSGGCRCKPGYVRNDQRKCIPVKQCPCPVKCKANEVYKSCANECEPKERTCQFVFKDFELDCGPTDNCTGGCVCKPGTVRNDAGQCVTPEKCCTDKNSELVSCPNPCSGGTCQQPEFSSCKKFCFPKGCQCKKGYVKKSATDATCVLKSQCPPCKTPYH